MNNDPRREALIQELMAEHDWSRAFAVEYFMERRYHGCSHERAIEQVNEKFRLATQDEFADANRGEQQ